MSAVQSLSDHGELALDVPDAGRGLRTVSTASIGRAVNLCGNCQPTRIAMRCQVVLEVIESGSSKWRMGIERSPAAPRGALVPGWAFPPLRFGRQLRVRR
jgi:hypothetical protein